MQKEKKKATLKTKPVAKKKYQIINTSEKNKILKESNEGYLIDPDLFRKSNSNLFTIKEASEWASRLLGKNVTTSNIS